MRRFRTNFYALLLAGFLALSIAGPAAAQTAPTGIVRAVMYWIEGCPPCDEVKANVLPPLQVQYGDRLDIRLIEVVSMEDVENLFRTAAVYGIPQERVFTPLLLIGDKALVGAKDIPAQLPGLIEQYMAEGGVDYPAASGLTPSGPSGSASVPVQEPAQPAPSGPAQAEPPASNGFTLAIIIMVAMVAAIGYTVVIFVREFMGLPALRQPAWLDLAVPVLAIAGLAVAGYLAYVETQSVLAVCGPVGDCNAVQNSPYAKVFGIPVGVVGMAGYIGILGVWAWKRFFPDRLAGFTWPAIFGMAFFGTLYSLYLTYLEPFVIGAVCIWCLSSAVIITLLMVVSAAPAIHGTDVEAA